MATLRLEADDAHEKVEELKGKVKTLEQENLSKEQEITSLNHRNQLLEEEVEKLESSVKEAKDAANQSAQHDTQNEALQRRVQLLEEEAEENDKTLRETNEKYDRLGFLFSLLGCLLTLFAPQAPPNRHQGRPLRAQGAGSRDRARPVGIQVRGDVQEALRVAEGPSRPRGLHQQRLDWITLGSGVGCQEMLGWVQVHFPIQLSTFFIL